MSRLIAYIKESKREMVKVNWPTRRETFISTAIVIGISLGVAAFLGALDVFFQFLLRTFVL
ncbi:MAG: preprotein translocase subunit SecE [Candidatus Ryanbacteria bacterium RIFCSPHIGHO2_02_FULL_45_43]|uniref:Protein translocase subunit SecE n=1 Tax=Candidatus Ryanbacteria bacterium RIFCSPHIGHO2_01_45_13 TaxID=1802112 RepID=A0A1G2FTG5_9BACT|nr:MAG: preprotein translocase subunit SecE [Candidatus Ryanbacteria bacterium RIFCSPHIGHO2_01_45_13]OGZ41549.1 MAG: preprotein translocase subunit SecE [Candidatus Ryanbacteria bacterium RIFCSPHIGHO2_01_FULL_44_130]OGZ48017.1 MAG: preprotein translocase subunit SecE [Candidatus Ryanbacteria bacterium RIFCSPHIGHO2_02_FULL_45_43]OGZ50151.1 MAG: preprotein translocase subunit SecE [Candidatus Ryanbacteria bacterium RIFCSPHIGHO2_12_FULL_44_20]OGZ51154.1 MAG: preprotein translocase subunit SecE [Ca